MIVPEFQIRVYLIYFIYITRGNISKFKYNKLPILHFYHTSTYMEKILL